MKPIFTLLASFILSISLFAVPLNSGTKPKSSLTVKSLDRSDIRVVVDGKRFEPGVSTLVVNGLNAGYHTLKIYRERNNGRFNIFGRRYEMVYNTTINVRAKTNMNITIDRFGKAMISETRIQGRDRGRDRDNDWDQNDGRSRDYDNDRDHDSRDGDFDKNDDREYDFDRDGKFGDYDTNYGYEKSMSDREFSQVMQSISKEWLETNKLKSATQVVTTSNLTSAQVKQLVLLFNFESNKLDLAKQAYRNTVDKKNYYMINDVFSFSGSKDELARFIRNFR